MTADLAPLYARVVAASGLAEVIAGAAVRRALVRAGVDPTSMTRRDLGRALPTLEACLGVYLPASRVSVQMEVLRRLAGAWEIEGT